MSQLEPAPTPINHFIEDYWDIFLGIILAVLAYTMHKGGIGSLATLFAALAVASFSVTVSEIAEILAERLKEPYGSFVLTFSAVAVEILLLFMILLQATSSSDALDTVKAGIISAVIVDMNVLLGLAVFIGGLSFKEQQHNEDTSSSYTTLLLVTASALLVPSILKNTGSTDYHVLLDASILIAGLLFIFYIVILIFQMKTHTHFFQATARSRIFRIKRRIKNENESEIEEKHNYIFENMSNIMNLFFIFIFILVIGFMAEIFATDGMIIFKENGISVGLAGLVIALISVSPEIFTAIKAARNDQIQRVVNIAMGASTVSILLTVPILMLLAFFVGIEFTLDFNSLQIGALILTVILAWKTTDDGQTNYFEGISHLMFFMSYAIITAFY